MRVTLPSGTPAELVRPGGDPRRGLVIAPDIMGLRPLFDELVARLATENGWAVCAPEPFAGREHLTLDERRTAVRELDDARQVGDLVAAADFLGVEPVAVMGFCMGGMYAFKAARTGRFDRAVPFYGMIKVPEEWRGPGHREPLECLGETAACPVLAVIGEKDPYTPPADVDELRRFPNVEIVPYAEAEHGFVHDPARPAHRAEDAADAWRRVVAFLS